ncbi:MAG: hypothetical protein JW955_25075 [Sedimentisphaerales bacterium]|nr:hypothetical protein [Sedimentisphaerales bacterium]
MKAIVEENKLLLRFYERGARILGWVLLCGGVVWLLMFVFWILAAIDAAGDLPWPGASRNVGYALTVFILSFVVPGSLALLIGQFIRYVLDREGTAGRMLRHGDWILYACAALLAGQALLSLMGWETVGARDPDEAGLVFVSPVLVPLLAKVLVCFALGQVLGRVLPILNESKTLV